MSTANARNCFAENLRLISPHSDPVQWNLNNGLANLVEAIEEARRELIQLRREVAELQHRLPR